MRSGACCVGMLEHVAAAIDPLSVTVPHRKDDIVLAAVIVTGERKHDAMRAGACCVGMLEHVAAAIDARSFTVPHRKDAVVLGALVHVDLLCAPYSGGGEILVQSGLKSHVMALEVLSRTHRGLIDAAERRAAITRDEPGSVEPCQLVALMLQHRQAYQCLRPAHIGAAAIEGPLVVECDFRQSTADGFGKGGVHSVSGQKLCFWKSAIHD